MYSTLHTMHRHITEKSEMDEGKPTWILNSILIHWYEISMRQPYDVYTAWCYTFYVSFVIIICFFPCASKIDCEMLAVP